MHKRPIFAILFTLAWGAGLTSALAQDAFNPDTPCTAITSDGTAVNGRITRWTGACNIEGSLNIAEKPGQVAIGTMSPVAGVKLDVMNVSTATAASFHAGTFTDPVGGLTYDVKLGGQSGGLAVRGVSTLVGHVGIGSGETAPANNLEVSTGGTTLADAWTARSSRRFKTNVQPLDGALEKVEQLQGVSYDRKIDGKHEIGVIAEQVDQVVPEVVSRDPKTHEVEGVDYARLAALLIEAVKSQQDEIVQLKAQIGQLTDSAGY